MLDYFNKDASVLSEKKLWLLDLDGTIYNENTLFEGVTGFLSRITEKCGSYIFVSNNSSKSADDYVEKLVKMGIKATRDNFVTSTEIAALYLKKHHPGKKVYCQGTESFVNELKGFGIDVTTEKEGAEAVLIGFDTELTTEKLNRTCEILTLNDIPYIATNPDMVCPVSFGFVPDCGSMSDMIFNATGKRPVFLGKPEPAIIELTIEKSGYSKDDAVFVGDRLYTDIAAGNNAGITTVCVLSGESDLDMVKKSEHRPTFTLDSVSTIAELL